MGNNAVVLNWLKGTVKLLINSDEFVIDAMTPKGTSIVSFFIYLKNPKDVGLVLGKHAYRKQAIQEIIKQSLFYGDTQEFTLRIDHIDKKGQVAEKVLQEA